jgi:uncharacterized protein
MPVNPLPRIAGMAIDYLLGLPAAVADYEVHRDVPAVMPDGVVLLGDHYRPKGSGKPLPVVLLRCPYGRTGVLAAVFVGPLARQGFQVFIQSTRGTFGSGGEFRPFLHERVDGLATVAWLRAQPWCDGRVSMTGPSYLGHTQWAIAPYVDPPLESVSLNVTASKITDIFYAHGAPGLKNALNWTGQIGTQERSRLSVLPTPVKSARMKRAFRQVPLQAADVSVAGAPVPFWRDFVGHPTSADPFWAEADHDGADFRGMPPVSMVTGWWDLFLPSQLRDFSALRSVGVDAWLTVGPWLHADPAGFKAAAQQDAEWLRHHLADGPPPARARVRLFLQQGDRWLDYDRWPPPAATAVFYLRAAGNLTSEAESGHASPSEFVYDPADPTPSVGGPLLEPPGKQADNASVEARPDVLTYTTDALDTDHDIVGPVGARIYVRTGRKYADLFVRLCDVDAAGVSRNITDGIRRLRPETIPADDVQIGEDGILAVDVELFPTAYRVAAGHRLRLQVSGGAFPRFARNFGTAEPFGTATRAVRCRFEVFADAERQSFVQLPLRADA